ncbi:SusC/RagA family TonB-linked outer membrane protein [Flaviramulus sp. BrNp1-15]|uniref:SusC/RagA family TonB-linked outer membrane protein n=1 Tax=Flaviramulus sp. BrNp1-15 TaxID=2916754 RepID=UPI001EE7E581|nr:SusC/RagA family TonB-linked outer membrane protein [Flaviramulus sp. BrNp1-15]ULC59062.1 SusC/RagA family TonB-linked outer membrane protein [Flaviramulus sp. BrNp1-15]
MKNKLLKKLLLPLAMLLGSFIYAQTVTGTVSDVSGPLPGVNVIVKGTTTGTQTDFNGKYSLDVDSADAILEFSFLGYATQQIAVNGQSTINVLLEEDTSVLDEVVVIGYGTTTVKDATGAVASVTSEDFQKGVISSPEQLIQGKTAGVQISQTSGEPGGGINVRIRGTNSVRSNNNPLFVVDGVPLGGESISAGGADITGGEGGTSESSNPLSFLNPNDIESISILKDASSTAIYGSRGANGVVIITTKTGKAGGEGVWEFNSSLSFSSPADEYDLLDRDQYLSAYASYGGDPATVDAGANTDWQDVVTRSSVSNDQNLSYSKNYGKGNIRGTFSFSDQQGVVVNSSLTRVTGRVNWLHRFLDDKLTVNLQATMSAIDEEAPMVTGSGGFRGDLLGMAYSANPTWPNDPLFDPGSNPSPANVLANYESLTDTNRNLFNASLNYDFSSEFSAKLNLGHDSSRSSRSAVISRDTYGYSTGILGNGRGGINNLDTESKLMELTLNYKKEFDNSNLDVLVGYSFQDFRREGININAWGFNTSSLTGMVDDIRSSANAIESRISGPYQQYGIGSNLSQVFVNRLFPAIATDNINAPSLAVNSIFADRFDNTDELQSFFGRVNYTIANKYLFTATFRADGSSRFGGDNQYGYFPSGAFAWKINEEDFIGDKVSTLKLRLGAGITGNQEGIGYGNFVNRTRYGTQGIQNGGDLNIPGTNSVSFADPSLKWEETTSYNVGLDFGFNNDRLSGSIDVYRKETTDFLLQIQAAQPSPQPFFFTNLDGTILNQGVEFMIAYDIIQSEDFNWNMSYNMSFNENELQDFGGLIQAGTIRGQGLTGAYAQILAGGYPLFSYFLREFEGFDSNGQPIGDVQTFVGKDAVPDVLAGLSTSLSYKNWDLSAYFNGQFDYHVYNNTKNAFFTAGSIAGGRNVTQDVIGNGESGSAAASVSTRFLEKGDFIRLQNATLGYNFPLSGEGTFKSLRMSLTGQNLLLITDYSGLDPEVSVNPAGADLLNNLPTAGIDWSGYPRPRTFTLGLRATF